MSSPAPVNVVSLPTSKEKSPLRSDRGGVRAVAIGGVTMRLPETDIPTIFTARRDAPKCTETHWQGLALVPFPAWVFDLDNRRMAWANERALRLWQAPSLSALRHRDFGSDMSPATLARLSAYQARFAEGEVVTEQWTFYPSGKATAVMCTCSGIRLEDGCQAMLVIGQPLSKGQDWTLMRGIEALRHIGVMVSLYDLQGQPLVRNPAALAAYSDTEHRFGGQFVDPTVSDEAAAALARGEVFAREAEVETAKGRRWHALEVRLSTDPVTGEPVMLVNERDITDRVAAEETVTKALREAQEANRAKSDFLATMSHELRTPLNAIIGFSRMIAEEQFGPLENTEYKSFAEDIVSSSEHLLELINDILDFARLETNRYKVEPQPVELARELERCIAMMRPLAEEAEISLLHDIPEPLPVVLLDRRAIRQIAINLISNGIKFTPPGGTVTVSVDFDAETMRVHVRDTGVGIAPADIPEVIKPFRQIGNVLSRQAKGTGLGLAICNALVELHQGHLELSSALGAGTVATVSLPRTLDLSAMFAGAAVTADA